MDELVNGLVAIVLGLASAVAAVLLVYLKKKLGVEDAKLKVEAVSLAAQVVEQQVLAQEAIKDSLRKQGQDLPASGVVHRAAEEGAQNALKAVGGAVGKAAIGVLKASGGALIKGAVRKLF